MSTNYLDEAMSKHPRICARCRYFDRHAPEVDEGKCRYNPPTATGGMMSAPETIWPIVTADDWCGQWELARK